MKPALQAQNCDETIGIPLLDLMDSLAHGQ
jgi:hypothetical protein